MAGRLPDIEQLDVFCTVCQAGHLNRAASVLGVSPSAVSQTLRKLESFLGKELFYRNERPLRLTPSGRRLLQEGEPIVRAAKALGRTFRGMDMPSVSLRLGLGEAITATISPWLVGTLHARVAELEVQSSLNRPLAEKLRRGELDVCIYSEGHLSEPQWERSAVYEEQFLGVCPRGMPAVKTLQDLRELAQQSPFICYTAGSSDRELADRYLHLVGIEPRVRIQTSSSYCLVGLVGQAGGWTLLPPTNIWSGARFAAGLGIWKLPTKAGITRRTWVVGGRARSEEVTWLAALVRRLVAGHTVPELKKISAELAAGITLLGTVPGQDGPAP